MCKHICCCLKKKENSTCWSGVSLVNPKHKFAMNEKQLNKVDYDIVVSDRGAAELTDHWQWRSSWMDPWVKGQSLSQSGTGRIPSAGCEESWPV